MVFDGDCVKQHWAPHVAGLWVTRDEIFLRDEPKKIQQQPQSFEDL